MTKFGAFAALAALMVIAGCGSDRPTMEGRWSADDDYVTFAATERDGQVWGTGTIRFSAGRRSIDVWGIHQYPHVTLTIVDERGRVLDFSGQWEDGRSVGGNIGSSRVVIRRQ